MFKLAHLSDIHLPPLPATRPTDLMNKRILGFINWYRKRKYLHRQEILDQIIKDLKQQNYTHLAITGDLTNLALSQEFDTTRQWLNNLGASEDITVIPGNHDAYTRGWETNCFTAWQDYKPAPEFTGTKTQDHFPFVRQRANLALIGLCSAVPTPPFYASGLLGAQQLKRLENILEKLRIENLFRVVLIHHPPLPGLAPATRALQDATDLKKVLIRQGAELVLFGHNHQWSAELMETDHGTAYICQAPSASQGRYRRHPLAGYNLFNISKTANGWHLRHIRRGLQTEGAPVEEMKQTEIDYR